MLSMQAEPFLSSIKRVVWTDLMNETLTKKDKYVVITDQNLKKHQ